MSLQQTKEIITVFGLDLAESEGSKFTYLEIGFYMVLFILLFPLIIVLSLIAYLGKLMHPHITKKVKYKEEEYY